MNEESAMHVPLHEPRQRLVTVTLKRARCPRCGGIALRKYRSIHDQGDGSAMSWVRCQSAYCGHSFKLVQE